MNWAGDPNHPPTALDLVKVSLTIIGGIGAVGYLVIKYRERDSVERSEADKRLLSAVEQLGSESPQVRIAGVYALADVADTYRGDYRQRVVDILCGYLRTKRGSWERIPRRVLFSRKADLQYVSEDSAVESTILSAMAKHLVRTPPMGFDKALATQELADDQLWCDCHLDLHGAVFVEGVPFEGVTVNSSNWHSVVFTKGAHFREATFAGGVSFAEAKFHVAADFDTASFEGLANFYRSVFEFDAFFKRAVFAQEVWFMGVEFYSDPDFEGVMMPTEKCFLGATLNGTAIDPSELGVRFLGTSLNIEMR